MGNRTVITLEGIDGAGTTTQADLLVQRIVSSGFTATRTQEPTNGIIGRIIRSNLRQEEAARFIDPASLALLFAADRLEHLNRVIKPALQRGDFIVSDRSVISSLAYQGMELDESWVASINAQAPLPRYFIWIDVPAAISMERIDQRNETKERYEKLDLLEKLAARYKSLSEQNLENVIILRIDGTQSVEAVSEAIWNGLKDAGCFDN